MFSQNFKNGFFKAACLGTALLIAAPSFANVTKVSQLVDVDPNVWAYKAVKELVEKYDIMEGYPDKTFKGNRNVTRYEMAQVIYELLKVMDVTDSSKIDGSDLETVGKLKRMYDKELSDVRNKVASLEGRVSALEADAGVSSTGSVSSWTDKLHISGDITNVLRNDFADNGATSGNQAVFATRARLGVDATVLGQSADSGLLGEGIAHISLVGGNGGGGTYSYATAGNNLDAILFDSSNANNSFTNNSLYNGRSGDSRMNAFIDQAYYTQVFNFKKTEACTNEVSELKNFFVVADLGQQRLWNTFHKSLVREDSLDGFSNMRVLRGVVGGSDSTTEALHLGFNWLGNGNEGGKTDKCGNVTAAGMDDCGNALPGFFQAFAIDYALAAHKNYLGNVFTTTQLFESHSHNLQASLLYDLPGKNLGTGLLSTGISLVNQAANLSGNANGSDNQDYTYWAKLEQFFGQNRTFGLFADYSFAGNSQTNYLMQGPVRHLFQVGGVVNTNFFTDKWNFNKDQFGVSYSVAVPQRNNRALAPIFTMSPLSGGLGLPYAANRSEQIIETYYRKYVTENISVTPNFLIVMGANGNNSANYSLGLRTTIKLPNWNDGGAFSQFGYRDWSQRIAKYKASRVN